MAWKWFDSEIIEIIDLTPSTKLFKLKVKSDVPWEFIPGQFITLDLPLGGKKRAGWRSYSIANAPNSENVLELCIVRLEGGKGTHYLFDVAKVGTIIPFKGPHGHFVLPEDPSLDIVAICTGTGIAPMRSMWLPALEQGRKFHIIFGTRTKTDILFENEMQTLAERYPNFRYSICLSREDLEGYHHGYVHNVYTDEYSQNTENRVFFLCGWSEMVDQARTNLRQFGIDKKKIISELFG